MKNALILATALLLSACSIHSPQSDTDAKHHTARFVKSEVPDYPPYAFAHRITGKVKIAFDVGQDGKVSELRILHSEPEHLFDDADIRAVEQWEFEKNRPQKDQRMNMDFRLTKFPSPTVRAPECFKTADTECASFNRSLK